MNSTQETVKKKRDADKDDATKPFANAEKKSAAEINHRGDHDNSRTYMGKGGNESEGPDLNIKSKDAEGDTSQNAGIFK